MKSYFKVAAFSAVMGLVGCRGGESEERPVHLIKNMDTQEKGKAYRRDTTGLFADGRMMRAPVEGTVAQGQLAEDDHWEEGLESIDGGALEPAKAFPAVVKDSWDEQVARGHNRYDIYCAPCHGPALDGQGTVAQKAFDGGPRLKVAPPDLHLERISKDMPVGKIYAAIRSGVNDGNMPSYAAQIPVADRWAIIAYVKAAQMQKDSSVPQEPGGVVIVASKDPTAEFGAGLYKVKGCNACHSLDGSKIVGPTFKGVWGKTEKTDKGDVTVDLAYLTESVLQPTAKIVDGFPPAMPPQQLSEFEIKSIGLFLETLK